VKPVCRCYCNLCRRPVLLARVLVVVLMAISVLILVEVKNDDDSRVTVWKLP
jgi:hypothetical protein